MSSENKREHGDGIGMGRSFTREEAKNYDPVKHYRETYGEDPSPEWLALQGYDPVKLIGKAANFDD